MTSGSNDKGTISVALVAEALLERRRQGLDDAPLLEQAGIAPALLQRPYARVSAQAYARLWRAIAAAADDEFFGMDGRRMKSGSFAYMAHAALREADVGRALESMLSFLGLIFDGLQPRLERQGSLAQIVLDEKGGPACRAFACFTLWLMLHGLACWLAGRRIAIDRTELAVSRPAQEDDLLLWGPDLRLGSGRTEVEFDSAYLRLPVVQDLPALKAFLRSAPQGLVIRFRNQNGLVAEVYRHLRARRYGQWPTLAALAQLQGISASTFRRQLEREGRSYQQIKDEVRRAMAFEHLREGVLSIAEVAELAGFQEPSAFHRAFKKWTGQSPGSYRARLVAR